MEVWVKGSQRQYIENGVITAYVGPSVSLESITTQNGWENTGEPQPHASDVTVGSEGFEQNKYLALIAAGISHLDAVRLSGYNA